MPKLSQNICFRGGNYFLPHTGRHLSSASTIWFSACAADHSPANHHDHNDDDADYDNDDEDVSVYDDEKCDTDDDYANQFIISFHL